MDSAPADQQGHSSSNAANTAAAAATPSIPSNGGISTAAAAPPATLNQVPKSSHGLKETKAVDNGRGKRKRGTGGNPDEAAVEEGDEGNGQRRHAKREASVVAGQPNPNIVQDQRARASSSGSTGIKSVFCQDNVRVTLTPPPRKIPKITLLVSNKQSDDPLAATTAAGTARAHHKSPPPMPPADTAPIAPIPTSSTTNQSASDSASHSVANLSPERDGSAQQSLTHDKETAVPQGKGDTGHTVKLANTSVPEVKSTSPSRPTDHGVDSEMDKPNEEDEEEPSKKEHALVDRLEKLVGSLVDVMKRARTEDVGGLHHKQPLTEEQEAQFVLGYKEKFQVIREFIDEAHKIGKPQFDLMEHFSMGAVQASARKCDDFTVTYFAEKRDMSLSASRRRVTDAATELSDSTFATEFKVLVSNTIFAIAADAKRVENSLIKVSRAYQDKADECKEKKYELLDKVYEKEQDVIRIKQEILSLRRKADRSGLESEKFAKARHVVDKLVQDTDLDIPEPLARELTSGPFYVHYLTLGLKVGHLFQSTMDLYAHQPSVDSDEEHEEHEGAIDH